MHRIELLKKLAAYCETWPDEAETTQRFIHFVQTQPDCFERSLPIGHITGSAWLVNEAGTHVLLTHHRKLGMWLQLGGHADGNPDILDAALREATEESGLSRIEPVSTEIFDLDIHLIPARKNEAAHDHYDVRFAFRTSNAEDYIVSDESHDLAWVEMSALEKYTTEESMVRMAQKWLDR